MGAIDNIFGATLCGVVAAAWIFGLICVLTFQYYEYNRKDPMIMKITVGLLCFLSLFNQVIITKMTYYYLVSSFGNGAALTSATWEWSTFIGIESFTATIVQLYYARRVLKLTRNWLFFSAVVLLSLCQLAFGLGTMGVTAVVKDFDKFLPWTWICLSWLGCSAACDILITVLQVHFLATNNSGIRSTERIIKRLVLYIVSTGVLTSVAAILELSTFAALGFNFVHVFISYPNGGLYTLSLLANLDARRKVRNDRNDTTTISNETGLEPIKFRPIRFPQASTSTDADSSFKTSIAEPVPHSALYITKSSGTLDAN